MYNPYNKKFSFIDAPSSIWSELVLGLLCCTVGLCCVLMAVALLMRIV